MMKKRVESKRQIEQCWNCKENQEDSENKSGLCGRCFHQSEEEYRDSNKEYLDIVKKILEVKDEKILDPILLRNVDFHLNGFLKRLKSFKIKERGCHHNYGLDKACDFFTAILLFYVEDLLRKDIPVKEFIPFYIEYLDFIDEQYYDCGDYDDEYATLFVPVLKNITRKALEQGTITLLPELITKLYLFPWGEAGFKELNKLDGDFQRTEERIQGKEQWQDKAERIIREQKKELNEKNYSMSYLDLIFRIDETYCIRKGVDFFNKDRTRFLFLISTLIKPISKKEEWHSFISSLYCLFYELTGDAGRISIDRDDSGKFLKDSFIMDVKNLRNDIKHSYPKEQHKLQHLATIYKKYTGKDSFFLLDNNDIEKFQEELQKNAIDFLNKILTEVQKLS